MNTENYTANISDKIQNDILTCVDGFMEPWLLDRKLAFAVDLNEMRSALCQIIVDNRKNSR